MKSPETSIEKEPNHNIEMHSKEIADLLKEYHELSLDDEYMIEFNNEFYSFLKDKNLESYKKTELYHKLIGSQLDNYDETPFEFYKKVKDFMDGFKIRKGIK